MNLTREYYRQNARSFFDSTANVDMSTLHDAFLSRLPVKAHLLDAGCGSGRDAKAFADRGHEVSAFDASPELAVLASQHCGFDVHVRTFADIVEVDAYDGIWCCASLLHVPAAELPACLTRLWRALRPGGCMYVSFKLGAGEREHAGRRFTDADDATLRRWLAPLSLVSSVDTWESEDRRPEHSERWLNALANVNTKAWNAALQRAGIENFKWHDLRHTFATWHRQAGTPTHELQRLGGWKTAAMVDRYAHVAPEALQGAAARLDAFGGYAAATDKEKGPSG